MHYSFKMTSIFHRNAFLRVNQVFKSAGIAELRRISSEIPERCVPTKYTLGVQPFLFKVMVVRERSLHDDRDSDAKSERRCTYTYLRMARV